MTNDSATAKQILENCVKIGYVCLTCYNFFISTDREIKYIRNFMYIVSSFHFLPFHTYASPCVTCTGENTGKFWKKTNTKFGVSLAVKANKEFLSAEKCYYFSKNI